MITGISVHDRVDWVFTITGMRTETVTRRMVPRLRAGYERWAFATGRLRHAHHGRTVMLNG